MLFHAIDMPPPPRHAYVYAYSARGRQCPYDYAITPFLHHACFRHDGAPLPLRHLSPVQYRRFHDTGCHTPRLRHDIDDTYITRALDICASVIAWFHCRRATPRHYH